MFWLAAAYLLCSSKKGISSHQLHRTLGVTYKTAWFLTHRIRMTMTDFAPKRPMGSEGGIIEADVTCVGHKAGMKAEPGYQHKEPVVSLVERGSQVRSFHIARVTSENLKQILHKNVAPEAYVMTDSLNAYHKATVGFASHETVNHTVREYVQDHMHTNTVEGVFSIFKRGLNGVYQHCGSQHLYRYLAEFDFHYNHRVALKIDDNQRMDDALAGIGGKRLTYIQNS